MILGLEAKATDQTVALDEYIELEQAQIDAASEELAAVYSEVTVTAEYPDTVVYAYTYAEPVDPDTTATEIWTRTFES